jgi:hypothetical protein
LNARTRRNRWRAGCAPAEILAIADISEASRRRAALAYVRRHGEQCRATGNGRRERRVMGINELVLVGTGFVLARVIYLFYFSQKKSAEADRS